MKGLVGRNENADREFERSGKGPGWTLRNRRTKMGELTDKIDAAGNKIAGKAKELAGKVTGNHELEAEGEAQQLKGSAQKVAGTVKGAFGDDI